MNQLAMQVAKMAKKLQKQLDGEEVAKMAKMAGGEDAAETARFVDLMDKFFDTVNVHNYEHGLHARKKFQLPYTSGSDQRLKRYPTIKHDLC